MPSKSRTCQKKRKPHLSAKGFLIFQALGSHGAFPGIISKLGSSAKSFMNSSSSITPLSDISESRILGKGNRSIQRGWIVINWSSDGRSEGGTSGPTGSDFAGTTVLQGIFRYIPLM